MMPSTPTRSTAWPPSPRRRGELGDPADHRHAAGGIMATSVSHLLLDGQRGVPRRRCRTYQPGHAVAHQVGNDRVGFLQVHREIGGGGGDRGEYAAQLTCLLMVSPFFVFRIRIQSGPLRSESQATAAFAVVGRSGTRRIGFRQPLPAVGRGGQQWPSGQVSGQPIALRPGIVRVEQVLVDAGDQARPDRHGRIAGRPPSSVSDSMWQ